MGEFVLTSPQGEKFRITAPDDATDDQVMDYFHKNYQAAPAPATQQPSARDLATQLTNQFSGKAPLTGGPADTDVANAVRSGGADFAGSISGNLVRNVANIGIAGAGSLMNLAGRPDLAPNVLPAENFPLTSEWFKQRMRQEGSLRDVPPGPVRDMGEGAGAGAAFGPAGIVAAAAGGLGKSLMESQFPNNPVASLVGQVAGSFLPAGVQRAAGAIPRRILATQETPIAQEGAQLENQTGVKLSLGQKSGNRALASVEHGLKGSSDDAANFFDQQAKDAEAHIKSVAETFSTKSPEGLTERAGRALKNAYDQTIKRLDYRRKELGRVAYGEFKQEVGHGPAIPIYKLRNTLDELSMVAAPGSVEAKAATNAARATLAEQLKVGVGKLTADQFLSWQQKINNELFNSLDKYGRGRLQKQLLDALYDDAAGYSGPASDKLQKAIGLYRRSSTKLSQIEDSAAATIFNQDKFDPHNAAEQLEKLSPSQITAVRNATTGVDKTAWGDATAAFIYRNVDKASRNTDRLATQSPFDPAQFLRQLPSVDHLKAMIPDPKQRERLMTGLKLVNRVSDKFGGGAAGIGVRQGFADVASNATSGNLIFIARMAGKVLGPIGLGKLLMTEGGHQTLRKLATQPDTSKAKAVALEDLLKLMDDDTSAQPEQ